MDWTANVTVTSPAPLDQETLMRAAEIGGVACGTPGDHELEMTFTVAGDDIASASKAAIKTASRFGTVVGLEVITTDEADRRLEQPAFPPLAGIREVAELLGVSRQRASELQTRPGFPAPVALLAAGPVWRVGDLSSFAETWERKPGRPRKAS